MGGQPGNDWPSFVAKLDGRRLIRHAVLTYAGTWAPPGVGYASDVVSGLNEYVNFKLCYEVPCAYPASFGPVGGSLTGPSYQESVTDAVNWTADWLADNPTQTFAIGGYSQGGEAASQVLKELTSGSLTQYLPNFIGGYTFGNPCRGVGFHATTIADPGGRGISSYNMTELPTRDGRVIWADYVHSPANGDAALDMYSSVPDNQVGTDMTLAYSTLTNLQFHNFGSLIRTLIYSLVSEVHDLGVLPGIGRNQLASATPLGLLGTMTDLLGVATGTQTTVAHPLADLLDVVVPPTTTPPTTFKQGATYAIEAAIDGLKFLMAPGGPTAPHISYAGEIAGYSNLVAQAVGFLNEIASAVTPSA